MSEDLRWAEWGGVRVYERDIWDAPHLFEGRPVLYKVRGFTTLGSAPPDVALVAWGGDMGTSRYLTVSIETLVSAWVLHKREPEATVLGGFSKDATDEVVDDAPRDTGLFDIGASWAFQPNGELMIYEVVEHIELEDSRVRLECEGARLTRPRQHLLDDPAWTPWNPFVHNRARITAEELGDTSSPPLKPWKDSPEYGADFDPEGPAGVKHDDEKAARYDLIPIEPLRKLAEVYGIGAAKYGDRNWERGLAFHRLHRALIGHALAWWGGERDDPDDGQHHLASVAWNALALMELENTHPELDDRPIGDRRRAVRAGDGPAPGAGEHPSGGARAEGSGSSTAGDHPGDGNDDDDPTPIPGDCKSVVEIAYRAMEEGHLSFEEFIAECRAVGR